MATEEQKAANQKAFDQMVVDVRFLAEHLDEVVEQKLMDGFNYKVLDVGGKMQSLLDLVRSVGGTHYDVPWYGFDGAVQPDGSRNTTRVATLAGWADALAATQRREIDTLRETVKAMAVATGVTIDYDAIARKVNDEADRRDRERLELTTAEEN